MSHVWDLLLLECNSLSSVYFKLTIKILTIAVWVDNKGSRTLRAHMNVLGVMMGVSSMCGLLSILPMCLIMVMLSLMPWLPTIWLLILPSCSNFILFQLFSVILIHPFILLIRLSLRLLRLLLFMTMSSSCCISLRYCTRLRGSTVCDVLSLTSLSVLLDLITLRELVVYSSITHLHEANRLNEVVVTFYLEDA